MMSMYSGIQLKVLSSLCFMFIKHLNSGILLSTQHMYVRVLTDVLVVLRITVSYAAYGKLSILVKALPKLMLYGKYGTQRVVLKQNIALSFALCYICLSPTLFVSYFLHSAANNNLTYTSCTFSIML